MPYWSECTRETLNIPETMDGLMNPLYLHLKTIEFKKRVEEIKRIIAETEHRFKHKGRVMSVVSTHSVDPIVRTILEYCEAVFLEWEEEIMDLHTYSHSLVKEPIKDVMRRARKLSRKLEKLVESEHVCFSCEVEKDTWLFIDPE